MKKGEESRKLSVLLDRAQFLEQRHDKGKGYQTLEYILKATE